MKSTYGGYFAALVFAVVGTSALAQRSGSQVALPAGGGAASISPVNSNRSSFPGGGDPMAGPNGIPDMMNRRMSEQQTKRRNAERQKKIETDTERLVDLANELKNQVGGESTLSPSDLAKRADQIEKLARSVKDQMKG